MDTLNKIVDRGDNVNFTTSKTSGESGNMITLFDQLVSLSKFALSSSPERASAIQRIEHHLANYGCTEKQRQVLEKVVELLCIGDIQVKSDMTIYKDGSMYYTKEALLQLLKHDDVLIIDPQGFGESYEGTAGNFGVHKPTDLNDDDILYNATRVHCGYIKLANKDFCNLFGFPAEDERREVEIIDVKTSLGR